MKGTICVANKHLGYCMTKDWTGNNNSIWKTLGASNHTDKERQSEDYYKFVPCKGYENRICINKAGQVFSLLTNKILRTAIFPNGYEVLCLMFQTPKRHTKTLYIHRLLAETFIPNPENKKTVNHIDGNKLNNIISNLEWATQSENNIHALRNNLRTPNMDGLIKWRKSHAALSEDEIRYIKSHCDLSTKELSIRLGNDHIHAISDCKYNKTYKDYL